VERFERKKGAQTHIDQRIKKLRCLLSAGFFEPTSAMRFRKRAVLCDRRVFGWIRTQ
jgi:hypothetical protein